MKWFKHWNDASRGHTLSLLWANNDTESIALWWRLLELLSEFEDPEKRGELTISYRLLARETGWKPSKCRRVLVRIASVSKIELNEEKDGNVSFRLANWLDFQETRGGKRSAKFLQSPGRSKKLEDRRIDVPLKRPTTAPDQIKIFEAQFDEIKLGEFNKLLKHAFEFFGEPVPKRISQALPHLIEHFDTPEAFKVELGHIVNGKNCNNGQYVKVALLRALGIIAEAVPA